MHGTREARGSKVEGDETAVVVVHAYCHQAFHPLQFVLGAALIEQLLDLFQLGIAGVEVVRVVEPNLVHRLCGLCSYEIDKLTCQGIASEVTTVSAVRGVDCRPKWWMGKRSNELPRALTSCSRLSIKNEVVFRSRRKPQPFECDAREVA